MKYGNGVRLTLGYTARLRPSGYKPTRPNTAEPTPLDVGYGHTADGLLRDSSDRRDATLGRAYGSDLKGRLAQALTGSEARAWVQTGGASAGTTTDGPYRQSYTFDEWNHTTSRWGRSFVGTFRREQTVSYTFEPATGRIAGWGYDADGRATAGDGVSNVYDAPVRLRDVSNGEGLLARFAYDGDGRQARRPSDSVNSTPTETYFLRSSVLGQAVAEVAPDGRYRRGSSTPARS